MSNNNPLSHSANDVNLIQPNIINNYLPPPTTSKTTPNQLNPNPNFPAKSYSHGTIDRRNITDSINISDEEPRYPPKNRPNSTTT